jgi:hypothetical protein
VAQPISFGTATPVRLFDLLLVIVTGALLLSFCPDRKKRLFAVILGIPASLVALGGHLLSGQASTTVVLIGHCLVVAFYFWAAVLIVASLFRQHDLTLDSIFGTICGYLLLGMAWAVLYAMLDTLWPASFAMSNHLADQAQAADARIHLFTYFSFITLMTVGYGDVTPVSTAARTCAWLEALTGQFYIAVLVAGLVSALLVKKAD